MSDPERPDDIPTYYVDHVYVSISVFTFTIVMSQQIPFQNKPNEVVPRLRVQMSPQEAKAMIAIATAQIEAYEAKTGVVLPTARKDEPPPAETP
jgi:hypothetical protein